MLWLFCCDRQDNQRVNAYNPRALQQYNPKAPEETNPDYYLKIFIPEDFILQH